MNKRTVEYMKSHDMDWLFYIGGRLVHCATNGAVIPEKYATIKQLNFCKREVRAIVPMLSVEDIEYNDAHIERVVKRQIELLSRISEVKEVTFEITPDLIRMNYVSSFAQMAMRGAYSYDYVGARLQDGEIFAQEFALVCKPQVDIPFDILEPEDGNYSWPDLSDQCKITEGTLLVYMSRRV